MHPVDQTIIQSLIDIRSELISSQPLERTALRQVSATLAQLNGRLMPSPELAPVMTLTLAGVELLQTLKEWHSTPSVLLTALVEALVAVEQFLFSEASPESKGLLDYALQALQQAVYGEDGGTSHTSQPQKEEAPQSRASEAPTDTGIEASALEDVIKEFLVESYENLDQLDRDLVTLQQDPSSQSSIVNIFRTIHTVKGTCGFFGFKKLESVTHAGESLLSHLRDGKLRLTPDITTALPALVDAVRQMLTSIENEHDEGPTDYSQLVEVLTRLQQEQREVARHHG